LSQPSEAGIEALTEVEFIPIATKPLGPKKQWQTKIDALTYGWPACSELICCGKDASKIGTNVFIGAPARPLAAI
jgi:hypothetical protein